MKWNLKKHYTLNRAIIGSEMCIRYFQEKMKCNVRSALCTNEKWETTKTRSMTSILYINKKIQHEAVLINLIIPIFDGKRWIAENSLTYCRTYASKVCILFTDILNGIFFYYTTLNIEANILIIFNTKVMLQAIPRITFSVIFYNKCFR